MADLPQLVKMLFEILFPVAVPLPARSGRVMAKTPELSQRPIRFWAIDQTIAGIDEHARSRASSLAGRARLGVANVPNDIVVDLVQFEVHFHVYGGADGEDVGEHVAGDAAVGVAAVEPDRVGVADMADHVAAEEQVLGAVELGCGGFPAAFGVGPAAPLDEIIFDERIRVPMPPMAFDAAVAEGVAAEDLRCPGLRRGTAVAVAVPMSRPTPLAHSMVLPSRIQ